MTSETGPMFQLVSKLRTFLMGQELLESERRRAVRIPCRIQVQMDGGPQVYVTNLSVLGLRIESSEKLRKDAALVLSGAANYPGHSLSAQVVWVQSRGSVHVAGLLMTGSNEEKSLSWVRTALDKLGANQGKVKERRNHVRIPTVALASLTNRHGDKLNEGQMRNLGLGGALFVSEMDIAEGTPVCLVCEGTGRTPSLNEEAVVRSCRKDVRSQNFAVGVQFPNSGSEPVRKFLKAIGRPKGGT